MIHPISPSVANAHRWLSHVSYYRLKHYTNKFKDARTRQFVVNSGFEQLIRVYLFDRDLKFIPFDAIETIEVALKNADIKCDGHPDIVYGHLGFIVEWQNEHIWRHNDGI